MKARLDELPYPELHPTIRALSDGGFDKELADLVRKPGNAQRGVEAMRRELFGVNTAIVATFQSLLDACHQDGNCHPDFTESRWPLESVAADEADWEVVEHYLTKTGTLEEGVKQLEKLAAKDEIRLLTGSRRAMEYIAQHQEAQLNHPIILPLRAQDSSDYWCLPVFGRDWSVRQRRLLLYYTDDTFNSDCGWLVLRRKQK